MASPANSLLGLPRAVRTEIYQRVLAVGHPLYLFQDTGCRRVDVFAPDRPAQWLALLLTNRQARLLRSFLDCIGAVNAGHVSHMSLNFPDVDNAEGQPMLGEDDLGSLKLLQARCGNLATLENMVQAHRPTSLAKASDDSDSGFIHGALSQIDAQFQGHSFAEQSRRQLRPRTRVSCGDQVDATPGVGDRIDCPVLAHA
ncbi:hypothetical protein G6O67_000121 [Ophiocordyceps sinensis]|uniref:Uncharacterized protein n=1 Tax=Ophiocordyceps sinensis TaxID=72228 RepID=A0A8H4PYL4_9HYPO|nr:hypothetical protein G6O67_000121 [Ophiocordyceps sinensis]